MNIPVCYFFCNLHVCFSGFHQHDFNTQGIFDSVWGHFWLLQLQRVKVSVKYLVMLGTVPHKALSIPKWQCADAEKTCQTHPGIWRLVFLPLDAPLTPIHIPSSFLFHFAAFQESQTFTARTLGRHWPFKIWKAMRISMGSLPSFIEGEQLAHVLRCCFLLG